MFPWGRLEMDGTFSYEITCARFDVLGGSGYGFWSQSGGMAPHVGQLDGIPETDEMKSRLLKFEDLMDGYDLLKTAHLSDGQGWKLPSHLMPYYDFSDPSAKEPVLVTTLSEPIKDWKS